MHVASFVRQTSAIIDVHTSEMQRVTEKTLHRVKVTVPVRFTPQKGRR